MGYRRPGLILTPKYVPARAGAKRGGLLLAAVKPMIRPPDGPAATLALGLPGAARRRLLTPPPTVPGPGPEME